MTTDLLSEVPAEDRVPAGAVIRVTGTAEVFDAAVGQEYAVLAYVSAEEGDAEPPQPYYVLEELDDYANERFVNAHQVVLVRSAAEQAERMQMPEPEEIAKMISSALHSSFGGEIEVYETTLLTTVPEPGDHEGEHRYQCGVEFAGRVDGGVRFAGTLRLTSLYRADF